MSFVSVLKKIGTVIVDGAAIGSEVMGFPFVSQLIGGLSPKIGTTVTTVTSDLNTIASIITTAEAMFPPTSATPQTGSQKIAAVTPLVQAALQAWATSNLPGKKPQNAALLTKGAGEVAQGIVDVMNSYGAQNEFVDG